MELTPRLRAVAEQVPRGAKFADIGTDHAYLPLWLILNGVIPSAIAADLRAGPLERARQTAARYDRLDCLSFRLCDGLNGIAPEEADVIAIAGMGGDTIASILQAAPWTGQPGKTLLLQPMTAQSDLRLWLSTHGYAIRAERIAREGNRFYAVLTVTGGEMAPLSPGELWAGKQSGDPLRGQFLDFLTAKAEKQLQGHLRATCPDESELDALRAVLAELNAMKEEWIRDLFA